MSDRSAPASPRGPHRPLERWLPWLALSYAAATLWALRGFWTTPTLIDDDARMHLLPFVAERHPAAFVDRFLVDYSTSYLPVGYRVLLEPAAHVVEPLTAAKALGLVMLLGLWALAYLAGHRLAGAVGGATALALAAHAEFLLLHSFGGLYRGFGIVLAMAWAATRIGARAPDDRLVASTWLVAAMAMLYPPLAIVCGLALALEQAAAPRALAKAPGPRLSAAAAAVVVSVAALWAVADKPAAVGPVVSREEAATMAAWSREGGRLKILPFASPLDELREGLGWGLQASPEGLHTLEPLERANVRAGDPFALAFTILLGSAALRWGLRRRWWLAWLAAALLVYLLSRQLAFQLGLPDRALKYSLPILAPLWPAMVWSAAARVPPPGRPALRGMALAFVAAVFLVYPAGLAGPEAYTLDLSPDAGLIAAAKERVPDGALLTGWPNGPAENLPLLAGRELLVNHEHAHPLYREHFAEVDRRLSDTLRLLFTTSPREAREIRDRWGLTHLVLRPEIYDAEEELPKIFRPYDRLAADLRDAGRAAAAPFLFADPPASWRVYEDERVRLVDLRQMGARGR